MKLILYLIFSIAVVCFGCAGPKGAGRASDEETESLLVYSVAIEHAFLDRQQRSPDSETFLFISSNAISDTTVDRSVAPGNFESRLVSLKERYPSIDEEILRSFLSKFLLPYKFPEDTSFSLDRCKFVNGDLVDRELSRSVLEGKTSELPGPVLQLSRVGFNARNDGAFFEMDYLGCSLCGFAASYYLEKKDDIWVVVERFDRWVS